MRSRTNVSISHGRILWIGLLGGAQKHTVRCVLFFLKNRSKTVYEDNKEKYCKLCPFSSE